MRRASTLGLARQLRYAYDFLDKHARALHVYHRNFSAFSVAVDCMHLRLIAHYAVDCWAVDCGFWGICVLCVIAIVVG